MTQNINSSISRIRAASKYDSCEFAFLLLFLLISLNLRLWSSYSQHDPVTQGRRRANHLSEQREKRERKKGWLGRNRGTFDSKKKKEDLLSTLEKVFSFFSLWKRMGNDNLSKLSVWVIRLRLMNTMQPVLLILSTLRRFFSFSLSVNDYKIIQIMEINHMIY